MRFPTASGTFSLASQKAAREVASSSRSAACSADTWDVIGMAPASPARIKKVQGATAVCATHARPASQTLARRRPTSACSRRTIWNTNTKTQFFMSMSTVRRSKIACKRWSMACAPPPCATRRPRLWCGMTYMTAHVLSMAPDDCLDPRRRRLRSSPSSSWPAALPSWSATSLLTRCSMARSELPRSNSGGASLEALTPRPRLCKPMDRRTSIMSSAFALLAW